MQVKRTKYELLLVEDEPALRKSLAEVFQSRGFHVITASRGEEAIRLANRQSPTLALLDMNLPDMTGVDVLRSWRENSKNWPAIFMTAEENAELRRESARLGALTVLDKPLNLKALFSFVEKATTVGKDSFQPSRSTSRAFSSSPE